MSLAVVGRSRRRHVLPCRGYYPLTTASCIALVTRPACRVTAAMAAPECWARDMMARLSLASPRGTTAAYSNSRLSHDEKRIEAQISLIPINSVDPANPSRRISDPAQLTKAAAGDLCVTITQDVRTNLRPIAALWFCTETTGPAGGKRHLKWGEPRRD